MKTTNFLRGSFVVATLLISGGLMAQGHHHGNGNGNGNGKGGWDNRDHHDQRDQNNHHDNQYSYHRGYSYDYTRSHHHGGYDHRSPERVVYVYQPAPVERRVVYHYQRPVRYVYYRDYDVYYDCQRSVYITYSGDHWSISTSVPVRMVNVDRTRVVSDDMDYYDDDFPSYMDRLRPKGEAYKDWAW